MWLRQSSPSARLTACDISSVALSLAQARGLTELTRASVMEMPYTSNTFDVVTSTDVLYIRGVDELTALREIRRVLKVQGVLILNVPALEVLRGEHDAAVATRRRYRASEIRNLLHESGYRIEWLSYWNMILLPLVAVVRWLSRSSVSKSAASDFRVLPRWLNVLLTTLIRAEVGFVGLCPLPIGSSVFSVARKVSSDGQLD